MSILQSRRQFCGALALGALAGIEPASAFGPAVRSEFCADGAPDSRVLILSNCDSRFAPTSPRNMPWPATPNMRRATANQIAVLLNREALHDNRPAWHCVARQRRGFCVLRVAISAKWRPASEYDFPPGVRDAVLPRAAAQKAVREFNRQQSIPVKRWAVVVHSLRPV